MSGAFNAQLPILFVVDLQRRPRPIGRSKDMEWPLSGLWMLDVGFITVEIWMVDGSWLISYGRFSMIND